MVDDPNVITEQDTLGGSETWESRDTHVKGKDVLNTQGERIAVLDDVVIDSNASIVGYELSKVFIEGPVAESKRIHANTTDGFGAHALIIDESKLYHWEL